jgi:hypothetical protein
MKKIIKDSMDSVKKPVLPDRNGIPKPEDTPSDIIWKALKKSGIFRTYKK